MSRGFQAAVTAACFASATLMAPSMIGFGASQAQAETTVKSSKSNTSDRMGGGGGKKAAGRMGGGGGKGQASRGVLPGFGGQLNPQPEPPGRAKAK